MSRSRPEALGIGLSAAECALAQRGAPVVVRAVPDFSALAWPRPSDTRGAAPTRAHVTLAADLVRWWVVDAPRGTGSLNELRQVAALRFEALFDEPAAGWSIVGDWSARGPSVCQAVPAGLAEGLRQAKAGGWHVVDVASAAHRLRARCAPAPEPRQAPWVWASVLLDRATLWWHRQGATFMVCTLGVDPANPWLRIAQELQRVGSLWPDGALPGELHWAAVGWVPPCAVNGVRCVHRQAAAAWGAESTTLSAAACAAAMGCA